MRYGGRKYHVMHIYYQLVFLIIAVVTTVAVAVALEEVSVEVIL